MIIHLRPAFWLLLFSWGKDGNLGLAGSKNVDKIMIKKSLILL